MTGNDFHVESRSNIFFGGCNEQRISETISGGWSERNKIGMGGSVGNESR